MENVMVGKVCPHCGSKETFEFKSDLYIVINDKEFYKKPFYGCMMCKSAFVIIEKDQEEKPIIKVGSNPSANIQKTLSRLSKGCLGVLENVK